jgi:hypothetical protein
LAVRLNRLVERWQQGGVERYSLNGFSDGRGGARNSLAWPLDAGIEITEHRLRLPGLAEAFREFRIVHLTDIHHGLYLPLQAVIDAVELANRLEPDIAALTGDFVTYSKAYIEPAAAILGSLRARCGVYAVLGNHDFRVGADLVARALRRERIEVLRNRHAFLRERGHALAIAGVDDLGYGANLARALRGIPARVPTVLLSHNPGIIRQAARHAVELVLSGHTHGGQVRLPLFGTIYGRSPDRLRFKSGWDRLGHTQIYVSRGIGTVVLPLRVKCPAEIARLWLEPHRAEAEWASDYVL